MWPAATVLQSLTVQLRLLQATWPDGFCKTGFMVAYRGLYKTTSQGVTLYKIKLKGQPQIGLYEIKVLFHQLQVF